MDFKLFGGVLKRYKRIVIGGTLLGIVLSVLSYGTPGLKGGKPTIIPRGSLTYQAAAELLISQSGYPYDRAVQQVVPGKGLNTPPETIGDLTYMSNLSSVYSAMADGSYVQHAVAVATHVPLCPLTLSTTPGSPPTANTTGGCGSLLAATVAQPDTGAPLPLITLTATAATAPDAVKIASTAISVLRKKITQEQTAAGTPTNERVQLDTVMSGSNATLLQGYKKTIPILVLFAIVSASIALAFILNNNSDDPVRSTRRRADEELGRTGLAFAANGNGNGHIAEPDHGLARTGGARMQLIGLRRAASGARVADEETAVTQERAAGEDSPAMDRRRAWSDRTPPHFLRGSGRDADSHD
jgi:hypothetical protein